jgi:disulfide bond formation protein DsbB
MASESTPPIDAPPDLKVLWTRAALFVAIIGVLGSLHLSLSMGLKACPLCFYQRAFMMSAAGVLVFGPFLPGMPLAALTVLALVPTFAGLGVAAWHTYMDAIGVLECPVGVTGFLAAPVESLIVFALLLAFLLGDLLHRRQYVLQGIGAVLLGLVFAMTCIKGTPTMNRPTTPYPPSETGLDGCRMKDHPK